MKKVVYTSPYVPAEWIAAHGLGPEMVVPGAAADGCGLRRAEGLCDYVKAWTNHVLADGDCAGAIFTTVCDQMRRAYEIAAADANAFLMNVPSTWRSAESKALYAAELGRMGEWLCECGGEAPSKELLAATLMEYDHSRRKASSSDARGGGGEGVAIALVGGPLLESDGELFDLVEKYGGRIALDATETGERTLPATFDAGKVKDDPVVELVRAYLEAIPAVWKRPNRQLFEWLGDKCRERKVRGLIYHRLLWCDMWHAELWRVRDCLDVPVLDLDVSDDSPSVSERTANRIQAFLETLE